MRYLLPEKGQFYKANLHCHSTLSDGCLTPDQLKAAYKANGYSVLAITDHEYTVDHSDMIDDDFVVLNGYEAYVRDNNDVAQGRFYRTIHMNFIAKKPGTPLHIMPDPVYGKHPTKHAPLEELPHVGGICMRTYTPGCINRMIQCAKDNGYLVFYNHPSWSREALTSITQYRGFIGMEVYNSGVNKFDGYPGDDAKVYDELLRMGQRIYAFANDDNHNKVPLDHPLSDSFGGFNMIKAEKLTYEAITEAIEKGDFYCSTGPTIEELYMDDDNTIHVKCSPAREVYLVTEGRHRAGNRLPRVAVRPGETLTHAAFKVLPEDGYVRLEVVDHAGYKAYTRAYFVDEIL